MLKIIAALLIVVMLLVCVGSAVLLLRAATAEFRNSLSPHPILDGEVHEPLFLAVLLMALSLLFVCGLAVLAS